MRWKIDTCFCCGNSVPPTHDDDWQQRVMLSQGKLKLHYACLEIIKYNVRETFDDETSDFMIQWLGGI